MPQILLEQTQSTTSGAIIPPRDEWLKDIAEVVEDVIGCRNYSS